MVPGLDLTAAEKNTDDRNLPPFSGTSQTSVQYGDTSFESCGTDDPDWAAGECQNLEKYTGIYRVKKYFQTTQQVTITVQIQLF